MGNSNEKNIPKNASRFLLKKTNYFFQNIINLFQKKNEQKESN